MKRTARQGARRPGLSISDQLRRLIASDGRTAYAISQASDVAPSIVSRFMAGTSGLTIESLDRIAATLGLRLASAGGRRQGARAESDPSIN